MKPIIIKVDPKKPNRDALRRVAKIVKAGGVVVYPTDTVYGLGADPFNTEAVARVYRVKKRSFHKPLPVLVSGVEYAREVVYVSPYAEKLMQVFWPGALTLVLPKKENVPDIVSGGKKNLAVRMPNHIVALALIELCGGCLIGTSANISGKESPRTLEDALEQIGSEVDAAVDAGPCPHGIPSTILDLSKEKPIILRKGPISKEEIEKVLRTEIEVLS
ncbi:MAG: threonylcarbamoyl-AMP synthase [Thermoprotei archaeon]|nr:MAG: threonylcarbamoyl-AMP synthase [Thermoprotei archaeon]